MGEKKESLEVMVGVKGMFEKWRRDWKMVFL